jgi:hypothetical protein
MRHKFTGEVLRRDKVVCTVADDIVVETYAGAPLYLQNCADFSMWLEDRCADLHRPNIKHILYTLKLAIWDAYGAVEYLNGRALNDEFWIRRSTESFNYEQLPPFNFSAFEVALQGDNDLITKDISNTPELTTIGSFNKGWRFTGGKYEMVKAGTLLEVFSEVFISKLLRLMGLDAVNYIEVDGYSVCETFVDGDRSFEAAKGIIGTETDYIKNSKVFCELGLLKEYMDIVFADAIVRNPDRHEFNYGVITKVGKAPVMAPNFDNNLALFADGVPSNFKRNDTLVSDFIDLVRHVHQELGYTYFVPKVTENLVRRAYMLTRMPGVVEVQQLVEFCMTAYENILKGVA